MLSRRRAPLALALAAVAVTAAACIPPRGTPPELSTTTTTAEPTTTTTVIVPVEGPFAESEPNGTSATADAFPAVVSGTSITGSLNDGDNTGTGDTDVFTTIASYTGMITVACNSGGDVGQTLTVENVTQGTSASSGPKCTSATLAVNAGDVVRITTADPVAVGAPYGLYITYAA